MKLILKGPRGEPVDFLRCLLSHGVADLPPFYIDRESRSLTVTLALKRCVRTVVVSSASGQYASIKVVGDKPSQGLKDEIVRQVRWVFRMDEDLSGFYGAIAQDPMLSWAAKGAGRMIRSQTVFEDIIKTICTTNCTWSATVRMVGALVGNLGRPAPGIATGLSRGRAFPTPAAMADAAPKFYKDVARAGYRGEYMRRIASLVADEGVDFEILGRDHPKALRDDEAEKMLLALPGVGPYASAHIMMMTGRYSKLILDSWTRPRYGELVDRKSLSDNAISKCFDRFGIYAGLAFWLFLTRGWVNQQGDPSEWQSAK